MATNFSSTKWTTKRPTQLKLSSNPNTPHCSTHHPTSTAQTLPNEQSAPGRITSPPDSQVYPSRSQSPTGTASPINATTPSTCFVLVARIRPSVHLKPWRDHSPSMPHQWPHPAPKSLYISNRHVTALGATMPPTDGTSDCL